MVSSKPGTPSHGNSDNDFVCQDLVVGANRGGREKSIIIARRGLNHFRGLLSSTDTSVPCSKSGIVTAVKNTEDLRELLCELGPTSWPRLGIETVLGSSLEELLRGMITRRCMMGVLV